MDYVTYADLSLRHSPKAIHNTIRTLEFLTQIHDDILVPFNPSDRLDRALLALNNINFAASIK